MTCPAARSARHSRRTALPSLAAAALFVLPAAAAAQITNGHRWTPEKSLEFDVVQETAIAPDGSRIAYVVREALVEGEQSEYLTHVWLVGADGSDPLQFTLGKPPLDGAPHVDGARPERDHRPLLGMRRRRQIRRPLSLRRP